MRKLLVSLVMSATLAVAATPYSMYFVRQDGFGLGVLNLYSVRVCNNTRKPTTLYGSQVIGQAQLLSIRLASNYVVQEELTRVNRAAEKHSKWKWYRYALLGTEFAGWGTALAAVADAWGMSDSTRTRVGAVGTVVAIGVRSLTTIYRHESPPVVSLPDNMVPAFINLGSAPACADYSFYAVP